MPKLLGYTDISSEQRAAIEEALSATLSSLGFRFYDWGAGAIVAPTIEKAQINGQKEHVNAFMFLLEQ